MEKIREVALETRGGGCYGGNWASNNPMRLFVVVWETKGLKRHKVAETEVEIIDGKISPKGK